jgi:hypothetical protein
MKRDHSEWWIDQHGRRWSAFSLWRAERANELRCTARDDDAGVRVYDRDGERDPLHVVHVPRPTPEDDRAGRALLTDEEREALNSGDGSEAVRDRLRWRVAVELPQDLATVRAADPDLYADLCAAVRDAGPAEADADDDSGETFVAAGR